MARGQNALCGADQRDGQSDASAEPASAILKRSLTLSLTNPKAILFYVSFFVQFIDVNAKTPAWRSLSWR
ncbi:transport protein [Klebsiella pneumoniae]|uniref:Transport protein n=1 Tax=Klebsiella pneumoniae TaxID=573 RepID=A0A2X3F0E1_KLEPN|nr:transport protein [Klebsiella pneumoniae]